MAEESTDSNDAKESNIDLIEVYAHCRVAIVGGHRGRLAKVVSLLHDDESSSLIPLPDTRTVEIGHDAANLSHQKVVKIEYLPCVATFDSYENEKGENVTYLAKVEYHGPDGKQLRGSSLAPFFDMTDDDDGNDDPKKIRFDGVSAVAIGIGVEGEKKISMLETFVHNLSGASVATVTDEADTGDQKTSLLVECIQPNSEYKTMKEENDAYRDLSEEEKIEATRLMTMGPGKMANFVSGLSKRVVSSVVEAVNGTKDSNPEETHDERPNEATGETSIDQEPLTSNNAITPILRNPNVQQYACKRCRTILFEEKDLQDPPHVIGRHSFRKSKGGHMGSNSCENIFLGGELDWMGDMSAFEGKLNCFKCNTKVGHWNWSGSQCSCGTWVTPAIQFPLGKVDVIRPFSSSRPFQPVPSSAGFVGVINPVGL